MATDEAPVGGMSGDRVEVLQVRYARAFGWLEVFDPFDRCWLEVWGLDAPPSWRRLAFLHKQHARQAPEQPGEVYAF
jgi:hypothetical protein